MLNNKIKKILSYYQLDVINYNKASNNHDSYKIITKDNQIYYLKEIDHIDILDKQQKIYNELNKYHIKTYNLIKTISNDSYIKYKNKLYILISDVIGDKITNNDLSDEHILIECATLLALVHLGLKNINLSHIKNLNKNEIIANYLDNNHKFINKYHLQEVMDKVRNELINLDENNTQLIHGDYHTGNILFNNNHADTIIDFDLAINGNPYFDISYFIQRFVKDKRRINLFIDTYKQNNSNLIEEKNKIYYYLLETELIVMNFFIGKSNDESALKCVDEIKYIFDNEEYYKNLK